MLTISNLFGRSPFTSIQTHMAQVSTCVLLIPKLFDCINKKQDQELQKTVDLISKLEHEADLTKNDIRNHLPKSLFLPVDRGNLLEIITLQDCLADRAEDIAILTTFKKIEMLPFIEKDFQAFLSKNMEAFQGAKEIINEFHELLESSFGGAEAEKVRAMVNKVAYQEHEADLIQRNLLKELYNNEDQISFGTFHLWLKIFQSIGTLANLSENLAYRVRMTLELK